MSALTGKLIESLGWQKTFIVEGLPSIIWAFVWVFFIKDFPSQTGWLKRESVATLDAVLLAEQAEVAEVKAVRQALLRPDIVLLAFQYFCWSLGIYGFVLWLPTIVRQGSGQGMANTGLLTAIPYAFAAVLMLVASSISDKTMKRVAVVWPFLMLSGIAMLGSYFASGKSFTVAFICLVVAGAGMYAPYGPYFAIIPERVPKNVTGEVMAMINSAGALGGFAGSYFVGWLQSTTGGPKAGFLLMSCAVIVSSFLILLLPKQPQISTKHATV
jgi:sugar phosphate permease